MKLSIETQQWYGVQAWLIELRFYVPPDKNRPFRRRSSQPISWLSTEKLNQTQHQQTWCVRNKIYCNTKWTPQKSQVWLLSMTSALETERAGSGTSNLDRSGSKRVRKKVIGKKKVRKEESKEGRKLSTQTIYIAPKSTNKSGHITALELVYGAACKQNQKNFDFNYSLYETSLVKKLKTKCNYRVILTLMWFNHSLWAFRYICLTSEFCNTRTHIDRYRYSR